MRLLPRLALASGLVAAAAGLGSVAATAPASAAVSGSTSSSDVVLYDHCQTHVVHYAVDATPDTTYWNLEIQVVDPDGIRSEGTVVTSNGSSPTGTATTEFCGQETPGTWTVHAAGVYSTLPGLNVEYALPDSTFHVRPAATRTTLHRESVSHGWARLVTKVTDERPDRFGRTKGATVQLQRRVNGSWRDVRGSRTQTFRGRVVERVPRGHRATYRAVTTGQGNYVGSVSAPVTVR